MASAQPLWATLALPALSLLVKKVFHIASLNLFWRLRLLVSCPFTGHREEKPASVFLTTSSQDSCCKGPQNRLFPRVEKPWPLSLFSRGKSSRLDHRGGPLLTLLQCTGPSVLYWGTQVWVPYSRYRLNPFGFSRITPVICLSRRLQKHWC